MIGIGDKFPEFTLNGVSGNQCNLHDDWHDADHDFIRINSWDLSDWSVIYFYPKDFTFICPTEISAMDILVDEANVIGLSGDNEFCKLAWKQENTLIGNIQHSLAADCGLGLSHSLGIVNEDDGVCYRATFIVDPYQVIQHVSVNALDTGRNAQEVLRTLKALKAGGLTGCSWEPGEEFVA